MSKAATRSTVFDGSFFLGNVLGHLYDPHVQAGALTLGVSNAPVANGSATVKITANGSAINVPGGWTNMGSDSVSIVAAAVNIITVVYVSDLDIRYTVKVA